MTIDPSARIDTNDIGENCTIGPLCVIEKGVVLGQEVNIGPGSILTEGTVVDDKVRIAANVSIGVRQQPWSSDVKQGTRIHSEVTIGASAVIADGVTIERQAAISPGTVITRDVPPTAIVAGNPASIVGYVPTQRASLNTHTPLPPDRSTYESRVNGVRLIRNPVFTDLRGSLVFGELDRPLPFLPKRYFVVYDVPSLENRGEHAHKICQQFLVCLGGSVEVLVDDGRERELFLLDSPELGLYLPAMTWATQYRYTHNASLLVLASESYDSQDYIRDYGTYLQALKPIT